MKKAYIFLLCYLTLFSVNANSQSNPASGKGISQRSTAKWVTKSPFQHDVFIENNGQFSDKEKTAVGKSIMYYTRKGKLHLYFSKHSITFRYDSVYSLDKDGGEPEENLKVKHLFAEMNFENASANSTLKVEGKAKDYFTYGNPDSPGKSGITAQGWGKLIYQNIYPGIDIEFYYPKEKGGLEYNIIVHPGGDASLVKMNYSSNAKLALAGNDMNISFPFMPLIDHSPSARIQDGNIVTASFQLHQNSVSFNLGNYDKSKTLVIDPWITTPLFTGSERVYDMDCDLHGNIYIYGGETPYYVEKLNSAGNILWTYTSSFSYVFSTDFSFYGGMAVDGHSGSTFISEGYDGAGGQMRKINTLGTEVAAYLGNSNYQELWRLKYNSCQSQGVVIGGGTTGNSFQTCNFDTLLVTMNPVQTVIVSHIDLAMTALDNTANCYIISSTNDLIKVPLASLSTLTYNVPSGFTTFTELGSVYYVYTYGHYSGAGANGFNGLATNTTALFGYDGSTLRKWNPATGAQVTSSLIYPTPFQSGGLVVDDCNHLFCGKMDSICEFDTNFNRVSSVVMPDTIYSLVLSKGVVYACGPGYVAASSISIPNPVSATFTVPSSCSACDGTATAAVNCGSGTYTYLWSDGQTTQTATGLCAGTYTLTVQGFSCLQDTAIINIPGKLGYTASVVDTNPNCLLSKGNITAYPTGGVAPYTYSWSNGETNQKDTGLTAGTYICTITDNTGCAYNVSVTLVNPTAPHLTVAPRIDSICGSGSVVITASGVKTYSWTPNSGLTCYNCPSPTASPTATTTYTIIGVDSNGCTAMATATVNVFAMPKPVITGNDSICASYPDTLVATGGSTYLWSNSATSSSIIVSPTTTKTITVTASNGNCTHDTTFTIHVVSPAAAISFSKDSVCQGDSIQLTGSGGVNYKWNTGNTTSSIWVKPNTTTTYTLHAFVSACNDSTTVTLHTIPLITATVSALNDTICPYGVATLIVTPTGGQATYKWSTGATTSSINVSDTITTTYTATVYGKCDSTIKSVTVTVIPLAKPVITGTASKCKGVKDTLTVSGGTTYKWGNGSTSNKYITGNINADSTIKVVAYNSLHCPDTTEFKITIMSPPNATLTYNGGCASSPITVLATASGSGPFTYLWSPGGQTTDTIDVTVGSSTTYTVTVSNGCKIQKVITVVPEVPVLDACCNTTINKGSDTIITASGTDIKNYNWVPSVVCLNPPLCDSVKVTPTVTTTYTVTGTDYLGCEVDRVITIVVESPCFDFTIPNVFTPNSPGPLGLNSVFYIKTNNLSSWSILIYDRWGKEMFNSTNPLEYWTGTAEGGGNATDGVYYYIINATCQGNSYKKDGFLQLIR
ncbi:MAG TPA: gliding motility-associated C-terminal domain-containing protein [Bacteroidia bacterium]|nr:gliding motility-associated C-terminal domain-containing protein [Bacteroidia bacterium]